MNAAGSIGARPNHGASHKYVILALAELEEELAAVGPLEIKCNPEETATA